MRRRNPAARFRPVLKVAKVAMAAAIDDIASNDECRHLLIRVPDDWHFRRIEDHRLHAGIDMVDI